MFKSVWLQLFHCFSFNKRRQGGRDSIRLYKVVVQSITHFWDIAYDINRSQAVNIFDMKNQG